MEISITSPTWWNIKRKTLGRKARDSNSRHPIAYLRNPTTSRYSLPSAVLGRSGCATRPPPLETLQHHHTRRGQRVGLSLPPSTPPQSGGASALPLRGVHHLDGAAVLRHGVELQALREVHEVRNLHMAARATGVAVRSVLFLEHVFILGGIRPARAGSACLKIHLGGRAPTNLSSDIRVGWHHHPMGGLHFNLKPNTFPVVRLRNGAKNVPGEHGLHPTPGQRGKTWRGFGGQSIPQ